MTLNQKLHSHPFPVRCHIENSLVVTYAFPENQLRPLIPQPLELDCFDGNGFLAIAMVRVREMRPAMLPKLLGASFILVGYRLFVRAPSPDGRRLRGLYILRSLTNSRFMKTAGNLFTHYHYQTARINFAPNHTSHHAETLAVDLHEPHSGAQLHIKAELTNDTALLPATSPFPDARRARQFCGPMPYTFDVPAQNRKVLAVLAERQNWKPHLVSADIQSSKLFTSLEGAVLADSDAQLASVFHVADTPYHWNTGVYL